MKRIALGLVFSITLALCASARAQVVGENVQPPSLENRDKRVQVPKQVDREEIDRRGSMVEQLGTINEGPVDLIAEALKPPTNDSDKWFVFVVTRDGDKASDQLKAHWNAPYLKDSSGVEYDNPLQSWAKPNEPLKSYAHFNILRVEDGEQSRGIFKDWFKGVLPTIEKGFKDKGAPAVILQPPKNGNYGENKIVVAMLFGYDGHPESMAARLRYAQHNYLATIIKSGKLAEIRRSNTGARIESPANDGMSDAPQIMEQVGAAQLPPFNSPTTPINPLIPSGPSVDIPPQTQYLSLQQIQTLLQGAPPEYIMRVANTNPTMQQATVIQAQWLQDKATIDKQQTEKANTTVVPNVMQLLMYTLGGSTSLITLVGIGLLLYRQARTTAGGKVLLDDSQFHYLLTALGIPTPTVVPPPNLPPLQITPNAHQ